MCNLAGNPCLIGISFPIGEVHCKQRLVPVEKTLKPTRVHVTNVDACSSVHVEVCLS